MCVGLRSGEEVLLCVRVRVRRDDTRLLRSRVRVAPFTAVDSSTMVRRYTIALTLALRLTLLLTLTLAPTLTLLLTLTLTLTLSLHLLLPLPLTRCGATCTRHR